MNHPTHYVYWLQSGIFTGATITGPIEHLAGNTPAGCGVICGVSDPESQRVDTETGEVITYQPPKPPDTALVLWSWDDGARRWVAAPTDAARAQAARDERDRCLAACDWVVSRATELGQPIPAAWQAYRSALRDVPTQAGFPLAVDWPVAPAG